MTIPYVPGPEQQDRTDFRLAEIAPSGQKPSRLLPIAFGMLVLAVLFAGTVLVVVLNRTAATVAAAPAPSVSPSDPAPLSALIPVCREQAKKLLRAPATAQFSEETVPHESSGTGWWQVNGLVDAQNGFGALVRNHYDCTSQRTPTGWQGTAVTFSPWN